MQIFQTNSSTRWTRFKWIICFALLAVIVSITVLIVALQQVYTPALPRFTSHSEQLTKWLPDNHNTPSCLHLAPGFQKYITQKEEKKSIADTTRYGKRAAAESGRVGAPYLQLETGKGLGIRSAFYVPWDPQSFFSLQRKIGRAHV
jgi:hypothetical protein